MNKAKVLIHTCEQRLWYVNDYMIPRLVRLGLDRDSIYIFNDDKSYGCLMAWNVSCQWIIDNFSRDDGFWHLQDDVIVSERFVEYINTHTIEDTIMCGFVCKEFVAPISYNAVGDVGVTNDEWLSFQCIYIPNRYIYDYTVWFADRVLVNHKYQKMYSENRGCDYFFWTYIKRKERSAKVFNIAPNLVNHVDFLIKGSVARKDRYATIQRTLAYYWDEPVPDSLDDCL